MDRKTAADILNQSALPVGRQERTYRTHPDKLAPYWNEVEELLKNDSKLKAYVLFEEMAKRHPEAFDPAWQRTFERRVRDWKLEQRIEKDVTFDQVHEPGDVLAIDFTNMNELGVFVANQKFDHMLFHAALTYSNWEYIDLCFSESFEALAKGIQGCFQAIGGVPQRIRNDSLSAAVNNLSTDRHFTAERTVPPTNKRHEQTVPPTNKRCQFFTYGSVRGMASNGHSYRDHIAHEFRSTRIHAPVEGNLLSARPV